MMLLGRGINLANHDIELSHDPLNPDSSSSSECGSSSDEDSLIETTEQSSAEQSDVEENAVTLKSKDHFEEDDGLAEFIDRTQAKLRRKQIDKQMHLETGNVLRIVMIAASVPLISVAKSVAAGIDPVCMTIGLSDKLCAFMQEDGFNNTWLQDLNLPLSLLDEFVSKHKLENLIREGALQLDDELYMVVENEEDGTEHERIAQITGLHHDAKAGADVTLYNNGNPDGEFKGCVGPRDLISIFCDMYPQLDFKTLDPWSYVLVRRGTLELGSLYQVRQSLHRWQIEMKAWEMWRKRVGRG